MIDNRPAETQTTITILFVLAVIVAGMAAIKYHKTRRPAPAERPAFSNPLTRPPGSTATPCAAGGGGLFDTAAASVAGLAGSSRSLGLMVLKHAAGISEQPRDFSTQQRRIAAVLSLALRCVARRSTARHGKARQGIFKGLGMKDIKVKIEGVTPLLCNQFTDAAAAKATSGNGSVIRGNNESPQEIAESKLYKSADGERFIIPQPNLFRCIIDAGKYFKNGKSKVTTQKTSVIPACVSIAEMELPITHKDPWTVDTRPVRIPSTGGRILCHRPCFNDWAISFTLEVDEEMMGLKLMREIVDAAGKRIGLGDFRPDCKGPFGKFVVTKWE